MIASSRIFVKTTMVLLLMRSAKTPAPEENRRKGMTKIAPTKERMALADPGPLTLMRR